VKNEYLLPRKAVIENVFALLEEVRNRPNCREEEMRKWVRELDRSKHALVQWALVDDTGGRLALTKKGEAIAWSNGRERDDLVLQHVVLGYEPYTVILAQHLKAWKPVLTTDDVLPIWARNLGVTLGRPEMSASAATMFGIMERAGLGRYLIGRGGKQTRIEFNPDAEERVKAMNDIKPAPVAAPDAVVVNATPPSPATRPSSPEPDLVTRGGLIEVKLQPQTSVRQQALAERQVRNTWAHAVARHLDDGEEGFEVYRRPGLEIKIRPTPENIARGIQFLRMMESDSPPAPLGGTPESSPPPAT
jgi:hypothetical protein